MKGKPKPGPNGEPPDRGKLLRALPSVERLLADPGLAGLGQTVPRWIVLEAVRRVLDETRGAISEGRLEDEPRMDDLAARAKARALVLSRRGIRKVINATGVVIHTNLGRSILAESAAAAALEVARSYCSLEYDLGQGERTSRTAGVDGLIARIVGSEEGFAVNNNAGAVLIALNTICSGKSTIVSRGELVEIGGSFRLPDIMEKSGSRLVEVGTTNRTRVDDYEAAITGDTAAILKVHHSNFAMTGYVESPSVKDLAGLAHAHSIVLIEDLGSGALTDLAEIGIPREPMPQASIAAGVDVVTFSGDKLLGGPQAGLIGGKRELVAKMKTNPLARALRLDKMTLAALEETLRLCLEPEKVSLIPTLAMLAYPAEELETRARHLAAAVKAGTGGTLAAEVTKASSQVGGGSMPLADLETFAVALTSARHAADQIMRRLRGCEVPIIARIVDDKVYIDMRTILPGDDDLVARQIVAAYAADEQVLERS
jgi:L-seryl-tRNA(Ser) seleniumtransferase